MFSRIVIAYIEKLKSRKPPQITAPALWCAIVFASGIVVADYFRISPKLIPVLAIAAICGIILSLEATQIWKRIAIFAMIFAVGAARYGVTSIIPESHWSKKGIIYAVRGIVCDFPEYRNNRWYATLKIISTKCAKGFEKSSGKVRLYFVSKEASLAYGQLWEIDGKPIPFQDDRNFFAPGYSNNLRMRGIFGSIHANDRNARLLDESRGNPILRDFIAKIHFFIGKAINQALPDERGALLEGMLLGGGRKLPKNIRDMFSNTGVIHILAVSGAHVGIVAVVLWWIAKKLFKLSASVSAIFVFVGLVIYAFLTQFPPAATRATVMASFMILAPFVRRKANTINSLGAAALFLLIIRPTDIFSPGFQLSFAATFGIVYFLPRLAAYLKEDLLIRRGVIYKAIALFLLTIAVQIAVAPICAYHFHKFQPIAPIVNLLVVPILLPTMAIGMAGIVLSAIFSKLGAFVLIIDGFLLRYILEIVQLFGKLKFAFMPVAHPSLLTIAGYYLMAFSFINILWNKRSKYVFAIGLLAFCVQTIRTRKDCDAVFLNVNGTCAYFETIDRKNALFCDCTVTDIENYFIPFLNAIGKQDVDILCFPLTKGNLANFDLLIDEIPHERLVISGKFPEHIREKSDAVDSISLGDISFHFLSAKNCIAKVNNKCFFLFLAPQAKVIPSDILFINFPYGLLEESTTFRICDSTAILGNNASGWRKMFKSRVKETPIWLKWSLTDTHFEYVISAPKSN